MNSLSNNTEVVWLSVDPVHRKVDFYPKPIAEKIEKSFNENSDDISKKIPIICKLGHDFFNATVHFKNDGNYYQTTPGLSMGRSGFKQPGYRSVRRIVVPDNKIIQVFTKQIHGELRITNTKNDSEKDFIEKVPNEYIIKSNLIVSPVKILAWKPENLDAKNYDLETNVVIWQWCKGISQKQGDLMKLSDNWWEPYLYEQNIQIENAFSNNRKNTTIILPINNTERQIQFIENSVFAKQKDVINNKQRLVRRKIVTIQELIELIYNINKKPVDVSLLPTLISSDEIPHEFFCCISQDIMLDPVKTIDGFTYDRVSIEKWFQNSWKSPLTGLQLESKYLEPNTDLKLKIEEFTKLKLESNGSNGSNSQLVPTEQLPEQILEVN